MQSAIKLWRDLNLFCLFDKNEQNRNFVPSKHIYSHLGSNFVSQFCSQFYNITVLPRLLTLERLFFYPFLFIVDVWLNTVQQVAHAHCRSESQLFFELTIIVEVVLKNEAFQVVLHPMNFHVRRCEPLDILPKGLFLLLYNVFRYNHGFRLLLSHSEMRGKFIT